MVALKIVKKTRNFSAPLFVIYDTLEPPKTPERPDPFCCKMIATIVEMDDITIMMFNMFFITL
jgi:hypothetical protein